MTQVLGGPDEYLNRYRDPALTPPTTTREEITSQEIARIARAFSVVLVASSIPRRIGDASDAELALEKKRCRRVAHALKQSLGAWSDQKFVDHMPLDDEIRREGATLTWKEFGEDHIVKLDGRQRLVASWAAANGESRWGKSAMVWMNNERNWLLHALR